MYILLIMSCVIFFLYSNTFKYPNWIPHVLRIIVYQLDIAVSLSNKRTTALLLVSGEFDTVPGRQWLTMWYHIVSHYLSWDRGWNNPSHVYKQILDIENAVKFDLHVEVIARVQAITAQKRSKSSRF